MFGTMDSEAQAHACKVGILVDVRGRWGPQLSVRTNLKHISLEDPGCFPTF